MKTINLEKELIKQNKKLVTPDELLLIKEYDNHTQLAEDKVLTRIGINSQVVSGKDISDNISKKKKQTAKYNQDKVFYISQIKSICLKYNLRFLNVKHYKGMVDEYLPIKIATFETAYKETCSQDNMYIIAPKKSFVLQRKPKDPLLFYKINDDYYYLVHKWGNDLNISRRFIGLLTNAWFSMFAASFIATLPILLIPKDGFVLYCVISLVVCFIFAEKYISSKRNEFVDPITILSPDLWNTNYK